jgi:hypothetical protein
LKSTITKIKNSPEGLNNTFESTDQRIRKLKDRLFEIIQSKEQKEKRMKKNEQRCEY